ncbi:hypothetical protein Taro_025136 [Colocasia esculenta]|uniref:Uncharacterized protein n=1 Tax=Colocasia esculenta TaxID=4460 RepID=A0A843V9D8_COLES|nr:hypothetical protein [Colocasia esculenta]
MGDSILQQSGTSFSTPYGKTIRQDFCGLVLKIREGVDPKIWGTTSFRYREQAHELRSSPAEGGPVLSFQRRTGKRYDRTSGAWFSKSVKVLSLKFGGQHPSGIQNRPMDSDRARIPAVRFFLFKAVRENDTAGLPGLGSRNP